MDVLHPIVVDRIESFGYDPDTPIAHCLNGWPGQHLGPDEPLRGDARLHHGCAALAVAYGMLIRHHLDQIAGRLDIPDDVLATGISVLARVGPRRLAHRHIIVHDVDDRQAVALPDTIVHRIVRRGHLDRTCAKLPIHGIICDHRD